jgi:hypothetical protein
MWKHHIQINEKIIRENKPQQIIVLPMVVKKLPKNGTRVVAW